MKQLIFKLVLPLTVISLAAFTKWWYALPVDAPDTMFTGFPLAYTCQGWHTSLSHQIFITEFIIDFLTYFLFWFTLAFCIKHYLNKVNVPNAVTICLWIISGLIISVVTLLATNKDNLFYTQRPFDMQVMETGYKFIWQYTERPGYYKYHPEDRKE